MNPIRRSAVIAVTSGVAVASLLLPSAASASTTSNPSAAAAGYLARHLASHSNHFLFPGTKFADDGETTDAVLSMDAAGVAHHEASLATKWLEQDAGNYLGGTTPNIYPGSAAKLLLVAEAQHVNPQSFGGINLVGAIGGTEGGGGAPAGEYQNPSDTTYSASVLVQSLAVLALANSTGTAGPSTNAVNFLAGQQCTDNAFQVAIRADTSVDCKTSDDDVDTTAYAIQALLATGEHAVADTAAAWLSSVERPDGGWGEAPGATSDANSTALAVEALVALHRGVGAGFKWLLAHQEGCKAKAGRRGAVLVSGHKYVAATAIRATSQAGAALALRPLAWIDESGAKGAAPTLKC